jgi:hypothetical protein
VVAVTVEHPVEIELKYRVEDPAVGKRLLSDDTLGLATGAARSVQHETTTTRPTRSPGPVSPPAWRRPAARSSA